MKSQKILIAPLVAVMLLMLAPGLFAQSAGTGALAGTVTDPSSAVVPNVTVTLTNNETGQVRTATTGAGWRLPVLADPARHLQSAV